MNDRKRFPKMVSWDLVAMMVALREPTVVTKRQQKLVQKFTNIKFHALI